MTSTQKLRARTAPGFIECDADITAGVKALRRQCAVMRHAHDVAGDPPLRRRPGGFSGLARIVVGALSGTPMPLDALASGVAQQGATALSTTTIDRAIAAAVPALDAVARKMHVAATRRAVQMALAS